MSKFSPSRPKELDPIDPLSPVKLKVPSTPVPFHARITRADTPASPDLMPKGGDDFDVSSGESDADSIFGLE